jgi:hypothetical protein
MSRISTERDLSIFLAGQSIITRLSQVYNYINYSPADENYWHFAELVLLEVCSCHGSLRVQRWMKG